MADIDPVLGNVDLAPITPAQKAQIKPTRTVGGYRFGVTWVFNPYNELKVGIAGTSWPQHDQPLAFSVGWKLRL